MKRFRYVGLLLLCLCSCSNEDQSIHGVWVPDVAESIKALEPVSEVQANAISQTLTALEIEFGQGGHFHVRRSGRETSGTFEFSDEKNGERILLLRGFGPTQRFTAARREDTLLLTQGINTIVMRQP